MKHKNNYPSLFDLFELILVQFNSLKSVKYTFNDKI